MTSFGWKRKSSQLSSAPAVFSPPDQDDHDKDEEEASDPDFDWIAVAKRRRVAALEDNRTLFLRLKQEGEVLSLHCLCIYLSSIISILRCWPSRRGSGRPSTGGTTPWLSTPQVTSLHHIQKTSDGCIK